MYEINPYDPLRDIGKTKIIVKNIPPEASEADLTTLFKRYGEMNENLFKMNAQWGKAWITYQDHEDAKAAVL